MWLSKGSNPREVTPIFPFFICIQDRIHVFFIFSNAKQENNYMKILPIIFILIFNEEQTNYVEMKMNCKSIICNELQ